MDVLGELGAVEDLMREAAASHAARDRAFRALCTTCRANPLFSNPDCMGSIRKMALFCVDSIDTCVFRALCIGEADEDALGVLSDLVALLGSGEQRVSLGRDSCAREAFTRPLRMGCVAAAARDRLLALQIGIAALDKLDEEPPGTLLVTAAAAYGALRTGSWLEARWPLAGDAAAQDAAIEAAAARGNCEALAALYNRGIPLRDTTVVRASVAAAGAGKAAAVAWLGRAEPAAARVAVAAAAEAAARAGSTAALEAVREIATRPLDQRCGATAITCAAYGGHAAVLDLLMQPRICERVADDALAAALVLAAARGHIAALRALLRGASHVLTTQQGRMCIYAAASAGQLGALVVLEQSGVSIGTDVRARAVQRAEQRQALWLRSAAFRGGTTAASLRVIDAAIHSVQRYSYTSHIVNASVV